jgi:endonuclease/exonuclease/phosphatase family metal-dependent hydrolase
MYLGFGLILNPQALLGLTPMDDRIAHLVVTAVSAVGAVLAVWSATWELTSTRTGKLLPVVAAVLSALLLYIRAAPTALWFIILALALWMALGRILRSVSTGNRLQPGLWRTSLVLFFSFLLMLIFIFLNEFDFHWITPAAATLLAVMSLLARDPPVYPLQTSLLRQDINRWGGFIAQAAMAAVVIWVVWNQPLFPLSRVPASDVLRVMTYNIHQGLNADIYMDLEEIAGVIEDQDADIIGLNEVNRGRANNGYTDTLAFISHRLHMPYVYGANFVDGQYGNAVLSRYPIDAWENRHYAANTTEVRGLLHAVIDLGAGREVNFFSTHLDHIGGSQNARAAQVLEAVDIIGSERTIFSGDLNAPPEASEMQPLYQGAWLDALETGGLDDAFTFWSDRRQRIDYVFFTPDLQLARAAVVQTRASDHLPVVVDFQLP